MLNDSWRLTVNSLKTTDDEISPQSCKIIATSVFVFLSWPHPDAEIHTAPACINREMRDQCKRVKGVETVIFSVCHRGKLSGLWAQLEFSLRRGKGKKKRRYYSSSRKTLNPNPLYISSTHDAEQRKCDWFTLCSEHRISSFCSSHF